jgi:hypothetical protein
MLRLRAAALGRWYGVNVVHPLGPVNEKWQSSAHGDEGGKMDGLPVRTALSEYDAAGA